MTDKIHGPRPTGLDPKVFEKNMMQVGRQQESLSKKEQDRLTSAKEAKENDVALQSQDRVDLTRRGEKAAEQTGLLPNLHTLKDKKAGKTTSPVIAEPAKPPVTSAPATETPEMSAPAGATPALGGPATETQGAAPPGAPPQDPGAPTAPGGMPGQAPGSANTATDAANRAKSIQDDLNNAQQIYMQMAANRQKWLMEIWKILQDTQTKIMEIMQQAAAYRAKVGQEMAEKWSEVIRGDK